jgi:AraC-like DNA-binding protein
MDVRGGSVVLVLQGALEWRIGRTASLELGEGEALVIGESSGRAGAGRRVAEPRTDRATREVVSATDVVLLTIPGSPGTAARAPARGDARFSRDSLALSPPLSLLVGLLREELSEKGAKSGALATALAKSFAVYLERAVAGIDRKRSLQQTVGDARIWKAMTLMHADPAKRWTVEQLARAVGLSRPVFARRFVENAGLSPLRYLARCRMELAAELLRSTEDGLAEIAARVGYDSEFAFGRAFKRHHHLSPGVFRRQSAAPDRVVMRSAA